MSNNRGGKREGAGRKALPPEERKVQRTVIFAPETLAWLEARSSANESIGHVIDRLVLRAMSSTDPAEYD